MTFLSPDQQRQSTEGYSHTNITMIHSSAKAQWLTVWLETSISENMKLSFLAIHLALVTKANQYNTKYHNRTKTSFRLISGSVANCNKN